MQRNVRFRPDVSTSTVDEPSRLNSSNKDPLGEVVILGIVRSSDVCAVHWSTLFIPRHVSPAVCPAGVRLCLPVPAEAREGSSASRHRRAETRRDSILGWPGLG